MTEFTPYNKLSSLYDILFRNHIDSFIKEISQNGNEESEYAVFYPSFGVPKGEKTDFIIYGQAVNGWTAFTTNEKSTEITNEAIKNSNNYYKKGNHNPIDWVNVQWSNAIFDSYCEDDECAEFYDYATYRAFRSFFWNVTYKLICDYYDIDRSCREWSNKIVWSNLYKITGQKRNPNQFETELLIDDSAKLVMREIEELKPKYCIFLTGPNWWNPFREILRPQKIHSKNLPSFITHNELYDNTQLIVTERPFNGNSELFAKQISSIMIK